MKKIIKFVSIVILFSTINFSCKNDNLTNEKSQKISESETNSKTELQIQEIQQNRKAFKKLVNVSDVDKSQTYTFEIGSFDEDLFNEAIKNIDITLIKSDDYLKKPNKEEVSNNLSSKTSISSIFIQVVNFKNKETVNDFMVKFSFNGKTARNGKLLAGTNVGFYSNNWPSQAILGRDPGSQGNVSYLIETRARWYSGYNAYNSGALNVPDLRNWYPGGMCAGGCWRVGFTMSWDVNGSWLYNFFY